MNRNALLSVVAMLLLLSACSKPAPVTAVEPVVHPAEVKASFINRVWKVSKSPSIEIGQLYVFLSEGTLVVASPHGKPSFGTWTYKGGKLTMVEEGIAYKVDILDLSRDQFRISSNNPGGSVQITLVPAEGVPLPE